MNILTFTTLFPNSKQQRHGVFVENRLRHLTENSDINITVVAPVPWFPSKKPMFGSYATFAEVPAEETRYGLTIYHPRYPVIPKIGMNIAPDLLFHFTKGFVSNLEKKIGKIDLIDAHYLYPDGVAAVKLSQMLNIPVTMTARGNDVTLIPNFEIPRKKILDAVDKANSTITVCKALKDELIELGADESKLIVLRNGVNLKLFHPKDKKLAQRKYAVKRRTLLSIGHLIERKGHHIVIEAIAKLDDVDLLIVGDGEKERELKAKVKSLGLEGRIRFLGAKTQVELPEIYSAVDAMVLASSREGLANVLLESMACGTPVIATALWGTPEVIAAREAGVLMKDRSSNSLIKAFHELFAQYPATEKTRTYAEQFSWNATTQGQLNLFERVIEHGIN